MAIYSSGVDKKLTQPLNIRSPKLEGDGKVPAVPETTILKG
jgi:hypothetical protein